MPLLQHTAQRRCPSGLRSPLVQTRERMSVPACTAWSHPCDARCRVARQRTHLFHPACRRHAMPCPLLSCWWAGRLPNGHSGAQLQPQIKPCALGGRSGTSWQPCEQGGRASTCAGAASPATATHALCKSFSRFPVFAAPHSSQPPPAPRLSKTGTLTSTSKATCEQRWGEVGAATRTAPLLQWFRGGMACRVRGVQGSLRPRCGEQLPCKPQAAARLAAVSTARAGPLPEPIRADPPCLHSSRGRRHRRRCRRPPLAGAHLTPSCPRPHSCRPTAAWTSAARLPAT